MIKIVRKRFFVFSNSFFQNQLAICKKINLVKMLIALGVTRRHKRKKKAQQMKVLIAQITKKDSFFNRSMRKMP